MSNLTYFAQQQWQRTEQRQCIAANISELLRMTERLVVISRNPYHWKSSPKIETAHKRLLEAVKVLQDELDER